MSALEVAWPPLVLAVAPNGARKTQADHPAIPISPAELAATAAAAQAAGAAMIHLHVRDADQKHSLDVGAYREATAAVREKVANASGFDASVKFDFEDDGRIVIDGKADPATVSNDDVETDCTVAMTLDDFEQMLSGDLDPTTAFMMGKLKVSGDMSVAMRLSSVI